MTLTIYDVFYGNLKSRATNFMYGWSALLAWAHLIHSRTEPDGDKPIETLPYWRLEDYA